MLFCLGYGGNFLFCNRNYVGPYITVETRADMEVFLCEDECILNNLREVLFKLKD